MERTRRKGKGRQCGRTDGRRWNAAGVSIRQNHFSISSNEKQALLYTVENEEQPVVHFVADKRHAKNRAAGVRNLQVGPQSWLETEIQGFGGEYAFCRLQNLFPDLSLRPRSGGADCLGRDGQRIDVKTSAYPNARLLAAPNKSADETDVFALMIGSFPGPYRFAGWAFSDELIQSANLIDLGYGPTYALRQDQLRAPGELNR